MGEGYMPGLGYGMNPALTDRGDGPNPFVNGDDGGIGDGIDWRN